MRIEPEKFYSLLEVQKLLNIKSRQYLAGYIKDGQLIAISTGKVGPRRRYAVKGEHILTFKRKYDKGLLKNEKYSIGEVRMILNKALDFAKDHGIKTLKEFQDYGTHNKN